MADRRKPRAVLVAPRPRRGGPKPISITSAEEWVAVYGEPAPLSLFAVPAVTVIRVYKVTVPESARPYSVGAMAGGGRG